MRAKVLTFSEVETYISSGRRMNNNAGRVIDYHSNVITDGSMYKFGGGVSLRDALQINYFLMCFPPSDAKKPEVHTRQ